MRSPGNLFDLKSVGANEYFNRLGGQTKLDHYNQLKNKNGLGSGASGGRAELMGARGLSKGLGWISTGLTMKDMFNKLKDLWLDDNDCE